jgi:hypothetical protein
MLASSPELRTAIVAAGVALACTPWPRTPAVSAPVATRGITPAEPAPVGAPEIPPLARIPEIYERRGDDIVLAPDDDQAVAQRYRSSPHGEVHGALRMTILTARTSYHVGEVVRVLHAVEAVDASAEAWVMGPKPVFGEHVDGVDRGQPPEIAGYPWVGEYDGAVVRGPAGDFNFNITTYTFDRPGRHTIEWRLGELRSNTIVLDVR